MNQSERIDQLERELAAMRDSRAEAVETAVRDAVERCARIAEEVYAGDPHHEHFGRRIADKIRDKAVRDLIHS